MIGSRRLVFMVGLITLTYNFAPGAASAPELTDDPPPVRAPQPAAVPDRPRYSPAIFRGGAARTGDVGELKLPATAQLLTQFDFDQGIGDAVIADGIVYVAGDKGSLFAVRLADSVVVWQDDGAEQQIAAAPTVAADRIYVATQLGLAARNRTNGKAVWNYFIPGGACESSPLPVGGRVLVAGYDGFIHAVNADGSLAWKHSLIADAPASPPGFDQKTAVISGHAARPRTMASDGAIVFVPIFDQSRVIAVDAATGQRRWSFQSKGWMFAAPAVAGDDVFVTSQDQSLYCLDKAIGRPRWSFPTRGRVESGAAVRDGSAYFGSCDGFFYRVDVATGKAVWSFETPRGPDGAHYPIYSSPIVSADTVCFASFDGHLYALQTTEGTLRWKIAPIPGAEGDSSPSTDGQRIYAGVRANAFKHTGSNSFIAVGEAKP